MGERVRVDARVPRNLHLWILMLGIDHSRSKTFKFKLHCAETLFYLFSIYLVDELYPQDESGCESSRKSSSKNTNRGYPIVETL